MLQKHGFVVGGFVALHNLESDSYQIKNIKTNEQALLMQRVATFNQRPHHFKFFPEGVSWGKNCLKELLNNPPDIAIVDEIGGYELSGKLWSSHFTLLVESVVPLIFTVKERLCEKVVEKWDIEPTFIFRPSDFSNADEAFDGIKKFI